MQEIKIDIASFPDFLGIASLDREAWSESEGGEFIPDGEHVWRVWVEHALVHVARRTEADGSSRIVGAALAFPCTDGGYCLHKLFVHRDARGRGLAQQLLASLVRELDKRKVSAFLTVHPDNIAALRTYQKLGFENAKQIAGYYRPEEDRLLLHRLPRL